MSKYSSIPKTITNLPPGQTSAFSLSQNLEPSQDRGFNIGSSTLRWRLGYIYGISCDNISSTGNITSGATVNTQGFTTITGTVTGSTVSTSSSTGAFIVTGGVGVGGALNVGGNLNVGGTLTAGSFSGYPTSDQVQKLGTGTVPEQIVAGSTGTDNTNVHPDTGRVKLQAYQDFFVDNYVETPFINVMGVAYTDQLKVTRVNAALSATDTTDAALSVLGGVAIQKNLAIGTTLSTVGDVDITSTTASSSSTTGALKVAGGVGVVGNVNVGGNVGVIGTANVTGDVNITSTTASSSSTTGALKVAGGVGVAGNVNVGGNFGVTGTASVTGNTTLTGDTNITSTTASSSSTTGALKVAGGVGVAGNVNVGGNFGVTGTASVTGNTTLTGDTNITSTTASSSSTTGALKVAGGVGVAGKANIGGDTYISSSTTSTSTGTGALKVTGGVGIGGTLNVGSSSKFLSGTRFVVDNATSGGTPLDWDSTYVVIGKDGANAAAVAIGYDATADSGAGRGVINCSAPNVAYKNLEIIGSNATVHGSNSVILKQNGATKAIVNGTNTRLYHTTASTSTTTGALVVDGGVGIAGNLNVGGTISGSLGTISPSYIICDNIEINGNTIDTNAGNYLFLETASGNAGIHLTGGCELHKGIPAFTCPKITYTDTYVDYSGTTFVLYRLIERNTSTVGTDELPTFSSINSAFKTYYPTAAANEEYDWTIRVIVTNNAVSFQSPSDTSNLTRHPGGSANYIEYCTDITVYLKVDSNVKYVMIKY
jgi:hypothetical protein